MRIHTGGPLSDGFPPPSACRGVTLGIEADFYSNVLLECVDCIVSVLFYEGLL